MDSTDGLFRGIKVRDTGEQIMMPVGDEILGRILNVIGDPVDELGPVQTDKNILFIARLLPLLICLRRRIFWLPESRLWI